MMMAFTLYRKEGTSKIAPDDKVYLHQAIEGHRIWRRADFWESAILITAYEELDNQRVTVKEKNDADVGDEDSNRITILIFGQLTSFAHSMLMFNVKGEHVKALISKFSKFFSLSEENTKQFSVYLLRLMSL